jgi:hypothetical protein
MQVPAGQHGIVLGDQVQDRQHLLAQGPVFVHHGERRRPPHLGLGDQQCLVMTLADVIGR